MNKRVIKALKISERERERLYITIDVRMFIKPFIGIFAPHQFLRTVSEAYLPRMKFIYLIERF